MGQPVPAPHLVNGLRHLLRDLSTSQDTAITELNGVRCGETDLIGFYPEHVEYSGVDVALLCEQGCFESAIWLLLNEELPDSEQLADCCSLLTEAANRSERDNPPCYQ